MPNLPDDPDSQHPTPRRRAPAAQWVRVLASPTTSMIVSLVIAVGGTWLIYNTGNTFGATAFAGGNALSVLMFVAFRARWELHQKEQTAAETLVAWALGLGVSAGVVALFMAGQNEWGALVIAVIVIFMAIGTYIVVMHDPDQEGDRPE